MPTQKPFMIIIYISCSDKTCLFDNICLLNVLLWPATLHITESSVNMYTIDQEIDKSLQSGG